MLRPTNFVRRSIPSAASRRASSAAVASSASGSQRACGGMICLGHTPGHAPAGHASKAACSVRAKSSFRNGLVSSRAAAVSGLKLKLILTSENPDVRTTRMRPSSGRGPREFNPKVRRASNPGLAVTATDCPGFRNRVQGMGIEEIATAPRSRWQNPYVERFTGSIRRECLDHIIIFNERHAPSFRSRYFQYHHRIRTHLSLDKELDGPQRLAASRNRSRRWGRHVLFAAVFARSQPERAGLQQNQSAVAQGGRAHRSAPLSRDRQTARRGVSAKGCTNFFNHARLGFNISRIRFSS
jgi:hypothetical protein